MTDLNETASFFLSIDGILTGIVSAFIFLFLVFFLFRPWILMGNHISHYKGHYRFKIISITPFTCTDFKIYLRQVVVEDLERGTDHVFEKLETKENPFVYIPSVFSGFRDSRPNCLQLKTEKDVKSIIKENGTYIELIVIAKHGLSGLQTTRRKQFKHIDCVDEGKFERGFSFKVIEKKT